MPGFGPFAGWPGVQSQAPRWDATSYRSAPTPVTNGAGKIRLDLVALMLIPRPSDDIVPHRQTSFQTASQAHEPRIVFERF